MTRKEYLEYHKKFAEEMIEVTFRKNHDYTTGGDDPFSNFRAVELEGICTAEQGFLVRMSDKKARLNSFVQKGIHLVTDESIKDTCIDMANYSCLFAGFLESKKRVKRKKKGPKKRKKKGPKKRKKKGPKKRKKKGPKKRKKKT